MLEGSVQLQNITKYVMTEFMTGLGYIWDWEKVEQTNLRSSHVMRMDESRYP